MALFCLETEPKKEVEAYYKQVYKTINTINAKTFFFKRTSFVYLVKEKKRYILITNLQAVIIPVPRFFAVWVCRKGLKKFGYKPKAKLVNNGLVMGLIVKRVQQWRKKK